LSSRAVGKRRPPPAATEAVAEAAASPASAGRQEYEVAPARPRTMTQALAGRLVGLAGLGRQPRASKDTNVCLPQLAGWLLAREGSGRLWSLLPH